MARSGRSARRDHLAAAWDQLAAAGRTGPLDERTCRLLELALALGAGQREAARAAHARAVQHGVAVEEIEQVLALAAGALGRHAALAAYGWLGVDAPGGAGGAGSPDSSGNPSSGSSSGSGSGSRDPKPWDA